MQIHLRSIHSTGCSRSTEAEPCFAQGIHYLEKNTPEWECRHEPQPKYTGAGINRLAAIPEGRISGISVSELDNWE